jgi:hypothetical protein
MRFSAVGCLIFTLASVVLAARGARAQPTPIPPVPATSDPPAVSPTASSASSAGAPPGPPFPEPAAAAAQAPEIANRLGAVEGRLEGIDESLAAGRSATERLSKIRLSGYVQGRYEWQANSADGLDDDGDPANENRFLVKRGRLKATYEAPNAEFVLQIDATGEGVVLKQAEATLVDTWSPFGLRLTVGQFKWPFGLEILQSSADREMPERSRMVRRLFPGEHDRGMRLQGRYGPWRMAVALVNGNGTGDNTYDDFDQNGFKDLVGRIGLHLDWLAVGVSGYWGRWLETEDAKRAVVDGTDTNGDGVISGEEIRIVTPASPAQYWSFGRLRVGADAQLTLDIPELGDLILRAEVIVAKDTNRAYRGVPADPCLSKTALGWMVTAVQNLGHFVGVVARLDSFDPSLAGSLPAGCADSNGGQLGTADRIMTLGGGLLVYTINSVKLTFAYEHPIEQGPAISNDAFTAQMQVKF